MTFNLLDKKIGKILERKGFHTPTPPQQKAISLILQGENVLLTAPTGSGKTEAVFLPILNKILEKSPKRIFCLYITPLRSLNRDLLDRLVEWGNELDIDIEVRHGDTTSYVRSQQVKDPPHILITTPETVQSIICGKKMKEHLKNVEYVVIDEIHELAGDKRGIQLMVGLERLKKLIGKDFRRIGLSATIGNKEEVGSFIQGSSSPVKVVEATGEKKLKIKVEWPEVKDEDFRISEETYSTPEASARLRHIIEIYNGKNGVLIFVNTRESAEILSSRLKSLKENIGVHHSSLSKDSRIEMEKSFKNRQLQGLVSTNSLALGIDIGHIESVIQYSSPRRVEILLQKIGRAGHSLEKISDGHIIVLDEDDAIESAIIAKLAINKILEKIKFAKKPFDVLAHQIAGLALDRGYSIENGYKTVILATPFKDLTIDEFRSVVNILVSLRIIGLRGEEIVSRRPIFEYYFSNLSMIPDIKSFDVIKLATREKIAKIDEEFAAELDIGSSFICKGTCWRVISKDEKIMVENAKFATNAPEWVGELMPVDFIVANSVGSLKKEIYKKDAKKIAEKLEKEYFCDEKAAKEIFYDVNNADFEPDPRKMTIEHGDDWAIIHAYFGNKVNETIGRILSSYLTLIYGDSVGLRTDQYRIMIKTPGKIKPETIKQALEVITPENIESNLKIVLKHGNLFKRRFLQVAKRFGVISKGAEFSQIGIKKLIEIYELTPVFEETIKEIFDEKLDIEKTLELVRAIKNGEIRVEVTEVKTAMAMRFLERYSPEIISVERPKREVLRLVRERLENRRLEVACLYCKNWKSSFLVKNSENLTCPTCGSKLIAIGREEEFKLLKKKEPTAEEGHVLLRLRKAADLYLSYGKLAFLALAGHGIGPETAARVLSKAGRDEEKVLEEVIEAEKTYARTRVFWDQTFKGLGS